MKIKNKMTKETFENNENRYAKTPLYKKLEDLYPECCELFLAQLVKVARSSNESELLSMSDILLEFAQKTPNPYVAQIVVETTIDEIFPVIGNRDSKNVRSLVQNEYSTVLDSLQKISEDFDDEISAKCVFGKAVLTFPENRIISSEN